MDAWNRGQRNRLLEASAALYLVHQDADWRDSVTTWRLTLALFCRYLEEIQEVRQQCEAKIAEKQRVLEEKAEEEAQSSIAMFETKYATAQADATKQVKSKTFY